MDYQKIYTTLFNAITDALSQIETQNYGDAKEILISAQQKAEEKYSLQGTTQSRYLTGGVPPVRFSM